MTRSNLTGVMGGEPQILRTFRSKERQTGQGREIFAANLSQNGKQTHRQHTTSLKFQETKKNSSIFIATVYLTVD